MKASFQSHPEEAGSPRYVPPKPRHARAQGFRCRVHIRIRICYLDDGHYILLNSCNIQVIQVGRDHFCQKSGAACHLPCNPALPRSVPRPSAGTRRSPCPTPIHKRVAGGCTGNAIRNPIIRAGGLAPRTSHRSRPSKARDQALIPSSGGCPLDVFTEPIVTAIHARKVLATSPRPASVCPHSSGTGGCQAAWSAALDPDERSPPGPWTIPGLSYRPH